MMLTEREKEIALQVAHRAAKKYRHKADEPYSFDDGCMIHAFDLFLSRIREEQEAAAWLDNRGGEDRVITNMTKSLIGSEAKSFRLPLFTAPPAAPECNCEELVDMLNRAYWELDCFLTKDMGIMLDIQEALANHAKLMKGGAQ